MFNRLSHKTIYSFYGKESGQVLVGVVVLLVLAMTLVATISNSFLKNLSQVTQADTASRATAVAEAGIERMLIIDTTTLEGYITNNNCGSVCTLTIAGSDGNNATANITLSFIGNTSANYSVPLTTTVYSEVSLNGYASNTDLYVCWNSNFSGSNAPSVGATMVSGSKGSYVATSYAVNSINSSNTINKFSTAYAANGFSNCFTVVGKTNPQILRLKSYYNPVTVNIVPANGQIIPKQGVVITSMGTFIDSTRKVVATKTDTALPSMFNYVLYQKSVSDPLSN